MLCNVEQFLYSDFTTTDHRASCAGVQTRADRIWHSLLRPNVSPSLQLSVELP